MKTPGLMKTLTLPSYLSANEVGERRTNSGVGSCVNALMVVRVTVKIRDIIRTNRTMSQTWVIGLTKKKQFSIKLPKCRKLPLKGITNNKKNVIWANNEKNKLVPNQFK